MKKTLYFLLALSLTVSFSQNKASFVYYQEGDVSLNMDVVYPPNFSKSKQYTTIEENNEDTSNEFDDCFSL